jgi:hypothetical protein
MATQLFRVVPRPPSGGAAAAPWGFRVPVAGVMLAGSRHGAVSTEACRRLIDGLGAAGFGFLLGCAPGVDACFRKALLRSRYSGRALVGCAFRSRARALAGSPLTACLVVPPGLSPAAALRRRTLWLVKRCCLAVLFPTDPASGRWGPGFYNRMRRHSALGNVAPAVFAETYYAQRRSA